MRKINNMTYLNDREIYNKINEESSNRNFSLEEIKVLLEEGKMIGQKIEDEWYASLCDVFYFINSSANAETYSQAQYGGGISVDLIHTRLDGRILDIGGGGEGIIGQLKSEQVIAIDPSRRELEEAPEGGMKIVMDAKELKFLDNAFDTVTSFFTLMYIPNDDHQRVFEEIYRVLRPNGEFVIWDINIPKNNTDKQIYIVYLEVTIPQKTIDTGYGTKWTNKHQGMKYFEDIGKSIGFEKVESYNLGEQGYIIRFRKSDR